MPIDETHGLELSTQDKTFMVTCAALAATYFGFAIINRRMLKKSLEAGQATYQETADKIAEIVDVEKQKLTDN